MKQTRFVVALALAASTFSAACAAGGTSGATGTRNVVAAEELSTVGDINLYDALSRLRPTFLRSRPAPNTTLANVEPTVYLDGVQMREGLREVLQSLNTRSVQEVRFLEAQQANARFGTMNNAGAIIVTSKK